MRRVPWAARAFAMLLGLLGVYFAAMGAWLLLLGDTPYYLLAGAGMVAAGVLTWRGNGRAALVTYIAVWVMTLIFAIGEAGADPWKLEVRLLAPTVLLLPFLHGWFRRRPGQVYHRRARPAATAAAAVGLIVAGGVGAWALAGPTPLVAQDPAAPPIAGAANDWRYYGGDAGGQRYSPAAQITPANVGRLKLAWTAHSDDTADAAERNHEREFHSEATPIKIGDTLFTCTPHSIAMAIDATTGRTKWRFDPKLERAGNPYLVCRGVAYAETADASCPRRIFLPMFNARIAALNADNGRPCTGFGSNGSIDLRDNAGPSPAGWQISTSPPMVANGRLVIGSRVIDNEAVDEPAGVVRAYDPTSGRLIWAWDVGRSPDAVQGPLPVGQIWTRGTPNVWGAITADPANGLVYLPTGNATPDYYIQNRRPFDDRFGSSIVALDIATGKLRWTFQTVHRDQWDFDLPIGPSLFDLPDGTPALIQTTKTGQIFMLNRLTGQPIAPVQERPVPQQGATPGQRMSPTQPFSVGMPNLTPRTLTVSDVWGATPIDQLVCRVQFKRARNFGIFTPTGPTRAIGNPAFDGVTDWGGAAIDPVRHVMTINTMQMPFYTQLVAKDTRRGGKLLKRGTTGGEDASALQAYGQKGTPYVATVRAWLSPFMTPCIAPPWGNLLQIDLATRKVTWNTIFGTARDTNVFGIKYNLPLPTGTPNLGGSIITAGGIVFIGATTDQYLRAYDLANGRELWKARLPAGAQATPMTYTARDGRQYVVITAGGHGALGTRYGDATMAFALPRS